MSGTGGSRHVPYRQGRLDSLGTIPERSVMHLIQQAVGMDKFVVMAAAIDLAKNDLEILRNRVSIDEEIETLELSQLAEQYGTGERTLREQIERQLSPGAVIKVGEKWVIRKRRFLDYLGSKRGGGDARVGKGERVSLDLECRAQAPTRSRSISSTKPSPRIQICPIPISAQHLTPMRETA